MGGCPIRNGTQRDGVRARNPVFFPGHQQPCRSSHVKRIFSLITCLTGLMTNTGPTVNQVRPTTDLDAVKLTDGGRSIRYPARKNS